MATMTLIMGPKKGSSNYIRKGGRNVVITTMELMKEIIATLGNGIRVTDLDTQ